MEQWSNLTMSTSVREVRMDFKVLPCVQKECAAKVVAGRGYCLYHGGPMRLDREFREREVEARAILGKSAGQNGHGNRNGASPKHSRKRLADWSPAGAPVGSGLSRWAKYDDARKPAFVAPTPAEVA